MLTYTKCVYIFFYRLNGSTNKNGSSALVSEEERTQSKRSKIDHASAIEPLAKEPFDIALLKAYGILTLLL